MQMNPWPLSMPACARYCCEESRDHRLRMKRRMGKPDLWWMMPAFECPTCHLMWEAPCFDDAPFRPFCSKRCKMIDLGRWLDGTYTISEPLDPAEIPEFTDDDDAPR